jgi:adenylate cyclase
LSSLFIYLTLVFTTTSGAGAGARFGVQPIPVAALVEQLASPEKLVLGGEQREMTIMFSDVRGFTTISEIYKDDPQGLTALMNGFLTPLTNAIIDRKGTIDKYMGDAIMAFWNAPLSPGPSLLKPPSICSTVSKAQSRTRTGGESGAVPFIPIQIGVSSGKCVVGNGFRLALRLFCAGRQRQSRLST